MQPFQKKFLKIISRREVFGTGFGLVGETGLQENANRTKSET